MSIKYSREELLSFNSDKFKVNRTVRGKLFKFFLWRPKRSRLSVGSSFTAYKTIKIGLLNAHSVVGKDISISSSIVDGNYDIFALTETWHLSNDDLSIKKCVPQQYSCIAVPRSCIDGNFKRGGGVAVIFNSLLIHSLPFKIEYGFKSFEILVSLFRINGFYFLCVVLYRPGSSSVDCTFFDEFNVLLSIICSTRYNIIILGDFNIHVNICDNLHAIKFLNLVSSYGLSQLVNSPTHKCGNTLDLVLTNLSSCESVFVHPIIISDHSVVEVIFRFNNPVSKINSCSNSRQIGCWKKVSLISIRSRLCEFPLVNNIESLIYLSPDELYETYMSTFRIIADELVPVVSVGKKRSKMAKWFDNECIMARRCVRKYERVYRNTHDVGDKTVWIEQMKTLHDLYKSKAERFWIDCFERHRSDPKILWRNIDSLLGRNDSEVNDSLLSAETLSRYFVSKVKSVSEVTDTADKPIFYECNVSQLVVLSECSIVEIEKAFRDSLMTTSFLDPVPSYLLPQLLDLLLPFYKLLINSSFSSGVFPLGLKCAVIVPKIKKSGLDINDSCNFRPVSNLPFLSKIFERLVLSRLCDHFMKNNLFPKCQSAYRPYHSTETVLLKVVGDILLHIDNGLVDLLALLDLSSAFDTVDHGILLERLNKSFCVSGVALSWLSSFLTSRSQKVWFGNLMSAEIPFLTGVPQGSVLGPLLFLVYVADLITLVESLNISIQMYADDILIYCSGSVSEVDAVSSKIVEGIEYINSWLKSNRLVLNPNKTEMMWVGSRNLLSKISLHEITVLDSVIKLSSVVKYLGVMLDNDLSFKSQCALITKSSFFCFKNLRLIKRYVPYDVFKQLVVAFILTRLDYCNSLFYSVNIELVNSIQLVQNTAARLIFGLKKFDHISERLKSLHWLPVRQRIIFKIAVLAFKCINGLCPDYLKSACMSVDLISYRSSLRSSTNGMMLTHRTKTSIGKRSFFIYAPSVWNSLPCDLRTIESLDVFRRKLKFFLFQ